MKKQIKEEWKLPEEDACYPSNEYTGTPLELMLRSVYGFGESKQFQIFGYLCKDLMDYFNKRGYESKAIHIFQKAYLLAVNRDRHYWQKCHAPIYGDLCALCMPYGFTQLAANKCWAEVFCDLQTVEPCDCSSEEGEVPSLPAILGWSIFREYVPSFVSAINGFQRDPTKHRVIQIIELAQYLLGKAVPDKPYWYPAILYISLLVHLTDFELIKENQALTTNAII